MPNDEREQLYNYLIATKGSYYANWFAFVYYPGERWRETRDYEEWVAGGRPESLETIEVTAEAKSIIAGVPGLQDALDYYRETGDRSAINMIMDALEANSEAAAEQAGTLGMAARAEVQTIEGLMFIVYYDEEGNVLPLQALDFLGEAPLGGLTPWQQAQTDNWANQYALQKAQLDWNIEQWGQQMGLSREELNLQKEQFEDQMGLSREQLELQKERLAAEIGIRREELELTREMEAARLALEERQYGAALRARPGRWIEAYEFEEGRRPPAPAWLPEYAPGVGAGRPITPERLKIPSAQAYGRMPWGQREMLGGYAEYAAVPGAPQTLTEIGERVGQMLPRERIRQARWQPVRQV